MLINVGWDAVSERMDREIQDNLMKESIPNALNYDIRKEMFAQFESNKN